jgi:hypothetical protein
MDLDAPHQPYLCVQGSRPGLAMAKVEGSNPFIRFRERPDFRGFRRIRGAGCEVSGSSCGERTFVPRTVARGEHMK